MESATGQGSWVARLVALAAACALLAGCGGDDDGGETQADAAATEGTTTEADTIEVEPAPGPASDEPAKKVKLWFMAGEQFHTVERELPERGSTLAPAVDALLAGPTEADLASGVEADSQIPPGTALEKVSVDGDGTATVRLSPEFTADIPSQSAERSADQRQRLNARLGQVTYTLTQFSDVKAAKVVSGGVTVEPDDTRQEYAAPAGGPKELSKAKGRKLPGTRQVQTKLAKLGYLPRDAVDGLNGYRTQQAVMAFQSWEGLGRDGVVGPQTSQALAVARRPKPQRGGPSKRIEVYIQKGVTLLVKNGRTKRAIHSSAGAPGTDTPTGRYQVFRKELQSWSVPFSTWLPYASYFNNGIAFHEYPDVPPFPASHGCVRLPAPEAPGVYEFAAIGTTVVVY